jgi:hypothetical protein
LQPQLLQSLTRLLLWYCLLLALLLHSCLFQQIRALLLLLLG